MTRRSACWFLAWLLLTRMALATDEAATKELQATIDKYVAAYNAGAVDKVMAYWAENADFVDIRGRFHEGRDLIAALFRRGFANNPGRKVQFTLSARKFLAPEVAMDDGMLELVSPDGEKDRGRYSVVWTKVNGNWLIRSARDIPLEEEEAGGRAPQPPPLEELALAGRQVGGEVGASTRSRSIATGSSARAFSCRRFLVKSADEDDFQIVTWIAYDPSAGRFHSWYFDSRGGFGGGPWTQARQRVASGDVGGAARRADVGSSVMTWEQVDANTAAGRRSTARWKVRACPMRRRRTCAWQRQPRRLPPHHQPPRADNSLHMAAHGVCLVREPDHAPFNPVAWRRGVVPSGPGPGDSPARAGEAASRKGGASGGQPEQPLAEPVRETPCAGRPGARPGLPTASGGQPGRPAGAGPGRGGPGAGQSGAKVGKGGGAGQGGVEAVPATSGRQADPAAHVQAKAESIGRGRVRGPISLRWWRAMAIAARDRTISPAARDQSTTRACAASRRDVSSSGRRQPAGCQRQSART